MSYVIQYSNGQYLAASNNAHTNNIEDAYPYMNLIGIQRAIEDNIDKTNIERFRGAKILTKAGEYVRHVRVYKHCLKGIKVTKETDKAILVNGAIWIPKSQCQIEESDIWISSFIWKGILNRFKLEASDNIIEIQKILKNNG